MSLLFLGDELKPPDMIAKLGTPQQTSGDKVAQISKNCCLVNFVVGQTFKNLRMRQRRGGLSQY